MIDYAQKAQAWYAAWNAHDAKAISGLYADNLVFISPFVTKMGLNERGVLTDLKAFQAYLNLALPRVPNLRFEAIANCVGAQGMTLVYRNQSSHVIAETHEFNEEGLIRLASAAYSTAPIKRKNYGSR
jgi:ketosteroid isomerase-like protein